MDRMRLVLDRHAEVHDHAVVGAVDERTGIPVAGLVPHREILPDTLILYPVGVLVELDAQRVLDEIVLGVIRAEGVSDIVEAGVVHSLDACEQLGISLDLLDVVAVGTMGHILAQASGHVHHGAAGPEPFE